MKLHPRKYPAPNNPINAPINGKRYMFRALVERKSSVCPNGIIVRKASKSLKVFIAFSGDIYPTLIEMEYRLCRDSYGRT